MSNTPTSQATISLSLQETFPLEELLKDMLEISPCGIVLLKPVRDQVCGQVTDFEPLHINPAARQMLNLADPVRKRHLKVFLLSRGKSLFGVPS